MRAARTLRAIFLAATFLAGMAQSANAQDYAVMGTATATMNDETIQLWIPYDRDAGEAYAEQLGSGPFSSITVEAFAGTAGQEARGPQVGISIYGPRGGRVTQISLQRPDEPAGRIWSADGDGLGGIDRSEVSLEGGVLTFDVTATVVAIERAPTASAADGDLFDRVPDAQPIALLFEGEVDLARR